MITAMRRLDLLLYHREKDAFLHELQEMGVVHIVENPDKDPASLQKTAELVKRCEHALAVLGGIARQPLQDAGLDGAAVLERFESLEACISRASPQPAAVGKGRGGPAALGRV